MIQHEVAIHLNRPVEQVFAFLADARNLPSWQSDLIEIQQLTDGPLGLGTRVREVRRIGARQAESQAEITVFEPNQRLGFQTLGEPQATVSYSFEPGNGGTQLRYQFSLLTGGMMRLLEPLIASSMRKQSESDFEKLKRVLES